MDRSEDGSASDRGHKWSVGYETIEQSNKYLSVPKVSRKVIGTAAELDGQYLMHPSARLSTGNRLNGSEKDFMSRLSVRSAIQYVIDGVSIGETSVQYHIKSLKHRWSVRERTSQYRTSERRR